MARSVFAESGVDASLDEIAKRAGLGAGTLYRHFPTRDDLLAESLSSSQQRLADRAMKCSGHHPGDDFADWFQELIDHLSTYDGLSSPICASIDKPDSALGRSSAALREASEAIIARAIAAGELRPDVTSADVMSAAGSIAWARGTDHRRAERLRKILLQGLRP